ncbi:Ankyrin-repeat and fibronectin type III domain-containing 1 [Sarracenia purpurea var. burkii]
MMVKFTEVIFHLKYRVPKFKNIALRENSHPYAVKKQRLTVKSVKNRNMRNVKRRQKMLDRSQTFNGYDNFAYRRSISELSVPKSSIPVPVKVTEPPVVPVPLKIHPDARDVSEKESNNAFPADNRITSYNWPVTSFYIDKPADDVEFKAKYSSTSNLSCKSDTKSANSFIAKKSNLKRHCSLGYLQDELYEYNFTRRRRSLDFSFNTLFAAVEHGYVEKTKSILESSEVDVNSVNSDGLSPLDVAVLSNNKPLVKVLVTYGAQEGRKFYSADDMRNHLYHLLHEAERRVQELGSSLRLNIESDGSSLSSSSSNIPSITVGDSGGGGGSGSQNKTYSIWERRAKGLKRMLMGFEQIRPPDPPVTVNVEVTSVSSLMVYFQESENKNSSITTKFRVQWSTDKDFCSLCGHYEVADTRQMRYHISNLRKGQSYYVRVASGNIKGYSAYKLSTPLFIVPSSWQDVTEKDIRFSTAMKDTFDDIFGNVVVQHPYLKSNVELYGQGGELLVNQQQRRKKTTIKQLFTAASKFQKHLRSKDYLSNKSPLPLEGLFTYMEVPEEEAANHRLYEAEVIEVSKDVSLIMVVPPVEAACSMPGQRELLLQRSDLLPLTVQYLQPPDPKTAKSRGSWPGVGVGRHLGRMPNEISRSEQHLTCDTIQNTQSSMKLPNKPPTPVEVTATDSESGIDTVGTSRSEDTLTKLTDDQSTSKCDQHTPLTAENSSSGSLHSVSLDELLTPPKIADIVEENDEGVRVPIPSSAVLQVRFWFHLESHVDAISTTKGCGVVHAAYNTGLDNQNVNFKFQVNAKTTAREIVDLFIKQTNMSVLLKGREAVVYSEEDTGNFCLVSVIGARERCLRDDFKPVQLQSPWNSGRLYVRRKSNVLAAIECDSKQSSSYV